MLNIFCDSLVYLAQDVLSTFGRVHLVDGRRISREELKSCDILITRSTTPVNEALLAGTRVQFVGSATIGLDHIDVEYLKKNKIRLAYAPGCNAVAVGEYVASTLAQINQHVGTAKTASIIGYGNVGQKVARQLARLGFKILVNDPPRKDKRLPSEYGYTSLDTALSADVICFHTPLVSGGRWPTKHLLNEENCALLKKGSVVLNAGRGAVIDNQALLNVIEEKKLDAIMDVFEGEPQPNAEFIKACRRVSPHIAGHSLEGKIRGTLMVAEALAQYLNKDFKLELEGFLPTSLAKQTPLKLEEAVPLDKEDNLLRRYADEAIAQGDAQIEEKKFDALRSDYQMRREFAYLQLEFDDNGL